MSGRRAKKLRQEARRMEAARLDDFKKVVEGFPFFERLALAWRIIWRCV